MLYNEKQLQIIQTAERLFSNKGYEGTSVRDIAEEAGVNLAMISYYFGSKEKLMEALFNYRANFFKLKVEELLKDDGLSPFEKIDALVDMYVGRAMEKQQFQKILLCEQVINKNPVIINLVNEIKKRNTEVISGLIKDGQKKGMFKKNVDVLFMMSTMIGTTSQIMISQDFYRNMNNLASVPDEEFNSILIKKISTHIKELFKAILSNET